jgi:hypothetical protein
MFKFPWEISCLHNQIPPNINFGYCPDCGEYVENKWFISRCACCAIKQQAFIKNGKIITTAKFCRNCGNNSFIIEELDNLDIVNINYAVLIKSTYKRTKANFIQTWIEESNFTQTKFLPAY